MLVLLAANESRYLIAPAIEAIGVRNDMNLTDDHGYIVIVGDYSNEQSAGSSLSEPRFRAWPYVETWWRKKHSVPLLGPAGSNYTVEVIASHVKNLSVDLGPIPIALDDSLADSVERIREYTSLLNVWSIVSFGNARQTVAGLLRPMWPQSVPILITVATTSNLLMEMQVGTDLLPDPNTTPHSILRLIPDNTQQAQAIAAEIHKLTDGKRQIWLLEDHSNSEGFGSDDRYHTKDVSQCLRKMIEVRKTCKSVSELANAQKISGEFLSRDIVVFIGYPPTLKELASTFTERDVKMSTLIATDGCDSVDAHGREYDSTPDGKGRFRSKIARQLPDTKLRQVRCRSNLPTRLTDALEASYTAWTIYPEESQQIRDRSRPCIAFFRDFLEGQGPGQYVFGNGWTNIGNGYVLTELTR